LVVVEAFVDGKGLVQHLRANVVLGIDFGDMGRMFAVAAQHQITAQLAVPLNFDVDDVLTLGEIALDVHVSLRIEFISHVLQDSTVLEVDSTHQDPHQPILGIATRKYTCIVLANSDEPVSVLEDTHDPKTFSKGLHGLCCGQLVGCV
jgi:hypothetical protein